MARVKKPAPTLDSILFATPEQRVLRLLLSEPTTSFSIRVISSKLKGIRGLGGAEGIMEVLERLQELGFVDFLDNRRAVKLQDENTTVGILKTVGAICDIEGLKRLLEPLSSKGILFGSRSNGRARSDSNYDLFVVTDQPDECLQIGRGYPLGKAIEITAWTPEQYVQIGSRDSALQHKLNNGIMLWGSSW
jgi:hypothetical protein